MIRVVIADDHQMVREGVKRILDECDDVEVIGEASDGFEVLRIVKSQDPDVVLLDINMPGPGFMNTLERLVREKPDVGVLVLSVHPEEQYAVRALKAGARGYVTKNHSPEELEMAVRRIYAGRRYVTESVADLLADSLETGGDGAPHEQLSDREYEVLRLLGAGKPIGEIGRMLGLSPKTVSTYRTRVLEKLNLSSTGELIAYAVRNRLAD